MTVSHFNLKHAFAWTVVIFGVITANQALAQTPGGTPNIGTGNTGFGNTGFGNTGFGNTGINTGFGNTGTQAFGNQAGQTLSAQGATPSAANQATGLRQSTGMQPLLIGAQTQVSVLGTSYSGLGFIGPDASSSPPDYFNANSASRSQGGTGGRSTTGRNSNLAGARQSQRSAQQRNANQQRNATNTNTGNQKGKAALRTALRSEITIRPQTTANYTARFETRFTRLPALERFGDQVQVNVTGRKAVLRGTVASKREAEMLTKLTLMEAGISEVDNQLVVKAAK